MQGHDIMACGSQSCTKKTQCQMFLPIDTAAAVEGHTLGVLCLIEAQGGGVDDFVFVDQGSASQVFALETLAGIAADGGELALFRSGDFFQELVSLAHDDICGGALLFRFKQALKRIAANKFRVDCPANARLLNVANKSPGG